MGGRTPLSELMLAVARVNRWATRRSRMSLPPAQGRLLAVVDDLGPTRIGALARADHCSQPTMTAQVQRLVEAGWLAREPDPDDARAVLVDLTEEGRALLAGLRRERAAAIEPLYEHLTAQEQRDVVRAAEILHRLLELAPDVDS